MRKVEFPHFWMAVYIRGVFCLEWWKFAEVLPAKCHSYGWASFEEKKEVFHRQIHFIEFNKVARSLNILFLFYLYWKKLVGYYLLSIAF